MSDSALPQVSFYHLQSQQPQGIALFCARLSEKAWSLGNTVGILARDTQHAERLDELLWSFRDDGFLPHGLCGSADDDAPVRIATSLEALAGCDLLINLKAEVPAGLDAGAARFGRIAEIIDEDPAGKREGRSRYSYYDKNRYPLEYHEIS
jgi:DNA polymerase-3 subunit chi